MESATELLDDDPEQVGHYRIIRRIGEGGMGLVYKAGQMYPIGRVVALKLIKPGMDSAEVIARFQSERQALAAMNHPGIAKVYDAGLSEAGRPYFVMEYVQGEPITAFSSRNRCTTRQRLELMAQACDAVHHAHQKAILHRDLKPGNILVTIEDDQPRVKIIDFGVAKVVAKEMAGQTLFTRHGQLIGTPEYMAPEQADIGEPDIDTRADIYSLGAVLYELLTGTMPFDPKLFHARGPDELHRIIAETDPPRPSARLRSLEHNAATEIADSQQATIDSLERELKSELEWVPLKALRKDRSQRYTSAAELAEDIQNYLHRRPLIAGPESFWYRVKKIAWRNRVPVAAALAIIVGMLGGLLLATAGLVQAARERDAAQRTVQQEREVRQFFQDVLAKNDGTTSIRDALDRAAERVARGEFRDRPEIEAVIRAELNSLRRSTPTLPREAREPPRR